MTSYNAFLFHCLHALLLATIIFGKKSQQFAVLEEERTSGQKEPPLLFGFR